MHSLKKWLQSGIKLSIFVVLISTINFLFFHYPFFKFVFNNVNYKTTNGVILIISLIVIMLVFNAFFFFIIFFLSRIIGKFVLVVFFIFNAIAVYFVNTYGVIIDESMIGNVLNTSYHESSSFFSLKLLLYILLLAILPSLYIIKAKLENVTLKKYLLTVLVTLVFIALVVFGNASNWLWIDKNSKQLGGLAMPWSYTVNIGLFYKHKYEANKTEILLPNATILNSKKSVMVLVIGESARSQNFSLYGYNKNTNPLLSNTKNVFHFNAYSCATYTTAGVKCILEHANTGELYEILPNYLYRNNVEVVWRSNNWGEPPIHILNYQTRENLLPNCEGLGCEYDEILLAGLEKQIRDSKKNKLLIVLHTSISHGPSYNLKYPPSFEVFKPVCKSVELGNCSQEELINAYDNTIVYTDYFLSKVIDCLKRNKEFESAMLFVSDHGESLGEKNLYMHGVPLSIAPKEQYDIPFIVWMSDSSKQLKPNKVLSQSHVFHSTLNFLGIQSPVYNEELNIFK